MIKEYIASIELGGKLTKIEFKTDERPVEYLWERYGMDAYIEYVKDINSIKEEIKE